MIESHVVSRQVRGFFDERFGEGHVQSVFVCVFCWAHGLNERLSRLFTLCAVVVPVISSKNIFLDTVLSGIS